MLENKPLFLNTDEELKKLQAEKPFLSLVDAFDRQIRELFFIENRQFIGQDKGLVYDGDEFKAYADRKKNDYLYVFYPWNATIVKTVKEPDYFALKTNRNQDLITATEQLTLSRYRVAVFGMSVGSNIAFVLTQAGISKKIVIADFDELDTTNLNRILGGVHQIGLNKTVVAARRIYEDNPFAEVVAYDQGINKETLEQMLANKEIDCIVEEIDDIAMKIETRKLAIKYKIPVVMITDNGDGVVLHIERYDLGYDQIFNKAEGEWDAVLSQPVTKEIAGKVIIGDIVGGPQFVDPKMLGCVPKVVNKELVSWPQLGSSAILGGVIATYALKEIVSGRSEKPSVVEYVKMPEIQTIKEVVELADIKSEV